MAVRACQIPFAQDMALADMLGFMPRMEDCACYRMNVRVWFSAYLRGVTLVLEPSSKVASCFVRPCGPTEACQRHCLGPAAAQTISRLTLLGCKCMHPIMAPKLF